MSTEDRPTQQLTDELVRMSHGNFNRVRELVDLHPGLVNARASWNESRRPPTRPAGDRRALRPAPSSTYVPPPCSETLARSTFLQRNPGLAHATGAHGIPVLFFAAMSGDRHSRVAPAARRQRKRRRRGKHGAARRRRFWPVADG